MKTENDVFITISNKTWKLIEKDYDEAHLKEMQLEARWKVPEDLSQQERDDLTWFNGFCWGMARMMRVIENQIEE